MSRATIEQAVTGLIPTFNGPLPSELIELGVSHLARSRSVANSLKPDEEIARPYACAQLACERLKSRLNLPTITSRPPCPPRIYKKLYKYLESALPATASRNPQTPRKNAAQSSASAQATPRTPLSGRTGPRSARREAKQRDEPPEWVMPTIRVLANEFSYKASIPHIYTGVESTLPFLAQISCTPAPETPSKRPRRATTVPQPTGSDVPDTRILALIAVMLFYVLSRMMDQDITPEQYDERRDKAISTLLESKAGTNSTEDDLLVEIEKLMPMAQEEGWLRMEWYLNIVPMNEGDEMEGIEVTGDSGDLVQNRTQSLKDSFRSEYIGLGTMMQDATDYLGARQKEDYKRWKEGIMTRVKEIEAS